MLNVMSYDLHNGNNENVQAKEMTRQCYQLWPSGWYIG